MMRYLVTPTLLNSWAYIWESAKGVKEGEADEVCYDDKVFLKMEDAKADFLETLARVQKEPTEAMLRGIEFENECYAGNQPDVSPIIEGGTFQLAGSKKVTVDGMDILMYGRLDVLKGGVIYDIKRTSFYAVGKYQPSYQHGFYLELFREAKYFEYLVYSNSLHRERYFRDTSPSPYVAISQFLNWLKNNGYLDLFKEKWRAKYQ